MLLNHNYAIETFLKELYHLHTFYSFKCSVIFTTDKIPKILIMYISCCLIIIMLLKHFLKELYHLHGHLLCTLNVQLSSQLTKFQTF